MSIAKNTAFMTIASIGQKIVSFFYFTYVARTIGVEGTGKYFFALSFTTVFVVFVDLGLTNVLVREAAKAQEKLQTYVSTILSVKLVLAFFTYVAAVITINILQYPLETRHLVYLSALTMLFDSMHLTLYGVLRALGNLRYEAISIVVSQTATLVLGTLFLLLKLPLIFLILAFTIPSFLNVCFVIYTVRSKYQIRFFPHFDKVIFIHFFRIAIPFALAAIFARIYSYADSILLSKMAGDEAVGWYSIAYKITFAFQFIPLALVASIYPRFSEQYHKGDTQLLATLFEKAIKYLSIAVFPISIGIAVLADSIILFLYGEQFLPSVLPLRILIVSLVFSFVSFPIGAFLNACDRQKVQTAITALVLCVNLLLNIIFIPKIGVVGAAIAAFVGNFLLTALGYWFVSRTTKIFHASLAWFFCKLAFATLGMGLVIVLVNNFTHVLVAIVFGVATYPLFVYVLKVLTPIEIQEAKKLLRIYR